MYKHLHSMHIPGRCAALDRLKNMGDAALRPTPRHGSRTMAQTSSARGSESGALRLQHAGWTV